MISIIALLIAILLPALSAARAAGQSVKCLSNLRQIGIAAHMYAHDHDNFLPTNYWRHNQHGAGLVPYLNLDQTTTGLTGDTVLTCPVQGTVVVPQRWNQTYAMNQYMASFFDHDVPIWLIVRKLDVMPLQSEAFLFMDGPFDRVYTNEFGTGDVYRHVTRIGRDHRFEHKGNINIVYADGHAATLGAEEFLSFVEVNSPQWRGGVQ